MVELSRVIHQAKKISCTIAGEKENSKAGVFMWWWWRFLLSLSFDETVKKRFDCKKILELAKNYYFLIGRKFLSM